MELKDRTQFATIILASLIATVVLYGCAINRSAERATEQLAPDMQSTEGRLDSTKGLVMLQNGLYYLSPTGLTSNSSRWLKLDKQQYVKQFAGQTVSVSGYSDYDKKSISVVSIQTAASGDTTDSTKQTKPPIQK